MITARLAFIFIVCFIGGVLLMIYLTKPECPAQSKAVYSRGWYCVVEPIR